MEEYSTGNYLLVACIDLLINDTIDKSLYNMKMSELTNTEVSFKEKLAPYQFVDQEISDIFNSVVDFAENMGFYFESSDFEEKKANFTNFSSKFVA